MVRLTCVFAAVLMVAPLAAQADCGSPPSEGVE